MDKRMRMMLIIAAVAAGGYFAWTWYKNRQSASSGSNSTSGAAGSNLSSVAPELIGGAAGPSVAPAVSTPVTITLNEAAPASSAPANGANPMIAGTGSASSLTSQSAAAAATSTTGAATSTTGAESGQPVSPGSSGTTGSSTVLASGSQDLQAIAEAAGITETQLIGLNPNLRSQYYGTGKSVASGTTVNV